MSIYPIDFAIIRVESGTPHCECCDRPLYKRLAIEAVNQVHQSRVYYHFDCALANDIVSEGFLIRLARKYKGKT